MSDRNFFQGARDDGGYCESAARAQRSAVEFFDRAADGDLFERRGREIDAAVRPPCLLSNLLCCCLNFLGVMTERIAEAGFCFIGRVRGTKNVRDDVCGLQREREMLFLASKRCRVKRRVRRNERSGGEIEIPLAVSGVYCKVLNHAGGGAN